MSTKRRQKQLVAMKDAGPRRTHLRQVRRGLTIPWFVTVSPKRAVTGSSTVETRNYK